MKSISKTRLARPTAQAIAKKIAGNAGRISSCRELKEGFFNSAYHVKLQDGFHFVLKIAPPGDVQVLRYEKDIMRTEVEVMRLVRSQTNIPVPEILLYDDSCGVLPSAYFAMEYINGAPLHKLRPQLTQEEQRSIDEETGRYLRQMNAISGDFFGLFAPGSPRSHSWAETFTTLVENVIQDAADACIDVGVPTGEISRLILANHPVLEQISSPALVHWDLWDGNIFVDPTTRKINGVIDFERALWADPMMEANFGAFGINQDFLRGYRKAFPFTTEEQTRRTLYNIYLYLIMIIECTYRKYPGSDQETWARMRLQEEVYTLNSATC